MATLNTAPLIPCPQCRNPIPARLEQVFDAGRDPTAKERFLRGQFNVVQCPTCGFGGMIASPLVYHDPTRELLLTYVPVELGMPREEKERALGQLTRAVVSRLAPEARKGYLLRPQEMLTPQGMVERILEADGITPEMLEGQRKQVELLRQLMVADESALPGLVKENDGQLDHTLFDLVSFTAEQAAASGDRQSLEHLQKIHAALLEHSTLGRESKAQARKLEATAKELRRLGKKLTREKLLDLVVEAEDETRIRALASMARPLMDYEFFMQLTRRIESLHNEKRKRLENVREMVLETVGQVDSLAQAQGQAVSQLLEALLNAEDLDGAIKKSLPAIDDVFLELLAAQIAYARKRKNHDMAARLERVQDRIMQLLDEAAPPEIRFINDLMTIENEEEAAALLKRRAAELTPALVETMGALAEDLSARGRADVGGKIARYKEIAERQMTLAKWTT